MKTLHKQIESEDEQSDKELIGGQDDNVQRPDAEAKKLNQKHVKEEQSAEITPDHEGGANT